jgi:hypothetical protein
MKMTAFWDIAPHSVEVDRHFRGEYCLHHQGDAPLKHQSTATGLHGATSQNAVIFILTAVGT